MGVGKVGEVYKCSVCGNIVEVLFVGGGELVCCGKPMELQEEKTADSATEKHVPVIEKTEGGILVKVGSVPHPMEGEHYIELIQLIKEDGVVIGKRLKPGDKPEAEFCCLAEVEGLKARIFCNLHGAWTN